MKNKKKKGFTLIELLAVVAIILILALIALPSLKGYKERANVSQAVASSKVLINAVDTYNAAYAGEIDNRGTENRVAGTIEENYKLSTILEKSHNYVDDYISEQEQGKLRKLISNDVTVEDLRTFVSENGKSENIIFKDGKVVLGK